MLADLPSADLAAKSLKIATAAAVDAKANRPDPSENRFCETETRVEEYWNAKYDEQLAFSREKIQNLLTEKNGVQSEFDELVNSSAQNVISKISTLILNFNNDLEKLSTILRKTQNEYDQFRRHNDLARTHKAPKPFLIYLTIIIFVAESAMNASIFMPVMQGGFVAGLVVSSSVALINVGYSFITGKYFLPQWNLQHPFPKLVAISLTVVWLAIICCVNFGAGLLRQLSANIDRSADLGTVFKDMAVAFNPALWPDFALNSVLLMVVGGFFALVSILDGYFSQDPYPGYARAGKNLDDARIDFEDHVIDARDELDKLHDDGLNILETAQRNARDESMKLQNTVIEIRAEYDQFSATVDAIVDRLKSNIRIYRGINKSHRTDANCPKYFDELDITDSASKHLSAPTFTAMLGANMDEDLSTDADALRARINGQIDSNFNHKKSNLEDAYSNGGSEIRQIEANATSNQKRAE
jgi:hypothetical protein